MARDPGGSLGRNPWHMVWVAVGPLSVAQSPTEGGVIVSGARK